jgi:hypothetical protein
MQGAVTLSRARWFSLYADVTTRITLGFSYGKSDSLRMTVRPKRIVKNLAMIRGPDPFPRGSQPEKSVTTIRRLAKCYVDCSTRRGEV